MLQAVLRLIMRRPRGRVIGGGGGNRSFAMPVWNVLRMPDYWADDCTIVVCVQGRHGADWAGWRGPFFRRLMIHSMQLAASRAELWGRRLGSTLLQGSVMSRLDNSMRPCF
jgi:hypothetical protein